MLPGAFFLLLLQVIKRKYQLLNKNIDYETYIIAFGGWYG